VTKRKKRCHTSEIGFLCGPGVRLRVIIACLVAGEYTCQTVRCIQEMGQK